MKRRSIVALGLVAVLAVAVAATTSAATKKTAANSITVWLQIDAQSGWPDVVAAANQQFQAAHPGTSPSTFSTRAGPTTCRSSTPPSRAAAGRT